MSSYESREELADKIDYEGGIYDMLFGYGLHRDDLPNDPVLLDAWDSLAELKDEFEYRVDAFILLLPGRSEDD